MLLADVSVLYRIQKYFLNPFRSCEMMYSSRRKRSFSSTDERPHRNKQIKRVYEVIDQPKGEGHFRVVLGNSIDEEGRFKIITYLGDGTFGKVVLAFDRLKRNLCAIKIVRRVERYVDDAKYEVKNMKMICYKDESDTFHFVRYLGAFSNDTGHFCIIMSQHGPSLYHHLSSYTFKLHHIADVCYQLLESLNFLHNKLRFAHTDLKPENILSDRWIDTKTPYDEDYGKPWVFSDPQKYSKAMKSSEIFFIRVCDFGGCQKISESSIGRHSIIQTRHYRAPEVILRAGWHCAADIWSLGCIAVELATGDLLYETHSDYEHVAIMRQHLGWNSFPYKKWQKTMSNESYSWFDKDGSFIWPPKGNYFGSKREMNDSIDHVLRQQSIGRILSAKLGPCTEFQSFVQGCLTYDPDKRLTAQEGLNHPFLREASKRFAEFRKLIREGNNAS